MEGLAAAGAAFPLEAAALVPAAGAPAAPPPAPGILPLTSTSDVWLPPRGRALLKFSYGFPEPSVEFGGLLFSFRIYTFENTYGLHAGRIRLRRSPNALELDCSRLIWAGGQQSAAGRLRARFRRLQDGVEWSAEAEMDRPVKSIAAILRRVPRGRISVNGDACFDPRDNELLFKYPPPGITTPAVVIETAEKRYFSLSCRNSDVRPSRFYFQPGPEMYRAELVYEAAGWQKSTRLATPSWRAAWTGSLPQAYAPHMAHVERAFSLARWEARRDVPDWAREIQLALALHGMHWSGYIFNDFAKMRRILEWTAARIPGRRVMVFLPAWDGRYYWNYPLYRPDPRLGGAAGLRRLIRRGHQLGFHFVLMFGANGANDKLPVFSRLAAGAGRRLDGNPYFIDWVDWDNDRQSEGWMPYMNLGEPEWRNWLAGRIHAALKESGADGYFLDIAGFWINNLSADNFLGNRQLTLELRHRLPQTLACGEMHYDALLNFLPIFQVFSGRRYPTFSRYARAFEHLSTPAPGRGSTGCHEFGFGHFNPKTLNLNRFQIPTITVVDDTFALHRATMEKIIAIAKARPAGGAA